MPIVRMTELDLAGQRVLIREDLNVPLKDGKIAAAQRLEAALPTIKLARDAGAKVMVMSHLGRPKEGVFEKSESLAPVGHWAWREPPLSLDFRMGCMASGMERGRGKASNS